MVKRIKVASYALVLAGLLANAYFMLASGEPGALSWWTPALAFFAWSALPFAVIAIGVRYLSMRIVSATVLMLTALAITSGGFFILVEAFVIHPDAQSGLVFIFLPFYQCVVAALGAGVAFLTRRLGSSRSGKSSELCGGSAGLSPPPVG